MELAAQNMGKYLSEDGISVTPVPEVRPLLDQHQRQRQAASA
jgi:hypothetical protein